MTIEAEKDGEIQQAKEAALALRPLSNFNIY